MSVIILTATPRVQRDVVTDLRRMVGNLEQQLRSARSHLETCKQQKVRHERESNSLRVAMQRKEDHVDALTEAFDKDNVEDGQMDLLRTTLKEAEEEKQLNENSLKDSADAMDDMMKRLKAIKQELAAKDANIAALQEELRVAQSEELMVSDKRRKIFSQKNQAIEQIRSLNEHKDKISREKGETSTRIVEFIEKASLVSPRVAIDEGETAASLDKKLERLHKDIERCNQQ